MLILSTIRVPLPQADYHNIRHHDGPGEICAYHDHLLRWHPSADANDDVVLLHWHWVVPLVDFTGYGGGASDRYPGQAVHAHRVNLPESEWHMEPAFTPDTRGR